MIQAIFAKYNTNKLSGQMLVDELIPHVGLPEVAESYIGEMLEAGTLIADGKKLILNVPQPIPEPAPEPTPEPVDPNKEIKQAWFELRQSEKTLSPKEFKASAEEFITKFGWNYFIFNSNLRRACEELGYHNPDPAERALFQREVLQKN